MQKKLKYLVGALLIGAAAQANAEQFSYTYIQAGYMATETDVGPVSVDGDTLSLSGSIGLGTNFFAAAGIAATDFDYDIEGTDIQLGVGAHTMVSENASAYLQISYIDSEIEVGPFSESDNGYGLTGGLRFAATKDLELGANVSYVDIWDDTATGFGLNAKYMLTNSFSIGAAFTKVEDTTGFGVAARAEF